MISNDLDRAKELGRRVAGAMMMPIGAAKKFFVDFI
jgi:hypothetical protein